MKEFKISPDRLPADNIFSDKIEGLTPEVKKMIEEQKQAVEEAMNTFYGTIDESEKASVAMADMMLNTLPEMVPSLSPDNYINLLRNQADLTEKLGMISAKYGFTLEAKIADIKAGRKNIN